MRSPILPAFVFLFPWLAAWLPAQTPASGSAARPVTLPAGKFVPSSELPEEVIRVIEGAAADAAAPQDPAAATPPDTRAQQLKQVRFDRRPSAALEAWAKPEPLAPDADPELALPPPPAEGQAADPAADPAVEQKRTELQQKRQARELEIVARDVTLGRWAAVGAWFATLPEKDRKPSFLHLLTALKQPPQDPRDQQRRQVPQQFWEQNDFTFDDLVGLAAAAPGGLQKDQLAAFAPLVQLSLGNNRLVDDFVQRLSVEAARPDGERVLDRRAAARVLSAVGQEAELGAFLPTADEAIAAGDREALNLLARHYLALERADGDKGALELAWKATQAALAAGDIDADEKTEALLRAVSLAPRIRAELGQSWLDESFSSRPERGMEILATIGAEASTGQQSHPQDAAFRKETLGLMATAVRALLQQAPERAVEWTATLRLLAATWQREAEHSYRYSAADSLGPIMRQDQYGNVYYVGGGRYGQAPVAAIEPAELLGSRPTGRWLELLEETVKPGIASVTARLLLKVGEEERAFPFIAELATTHAEQAQELANEFLRVWIKNNDPNSERNRTSSYMFSYGYDYRSSGIPLTRSKQERNLKSLAEWVARLRAMPIGELDVALLVQAFVASHSVAEVYRLETIQSVFGGLEGLDAPTIATLVEGMRRNLATVWRMPRVQQAAKTNRKQKDIEAEVVRGYAVARGVIDMALAKHADAWQLVLADAAVRHDENEFRSELAASTEYASARGEALGMFARAARLYAAQLDPESTKDESTSVYETWFYAALGASDLGGIDDTSVPDLTQIPKIARAIGALPGDVAERHRGRFANSLFTRMSAVNPSVKFRYLENGFAIAGDHEQAREARRLFDYYKDLVTEIRLDVRVDGDDDVGLEPFGLVVDLVHTREIERESGGFGRYLQNQNSQPYANNYGRPTENYRDKFEAAARAALGETFEVQSVTFNVESASSKATDDYGWRRTPHAYVLVKARRAEVDKVPPLKLDLDFLDTTGYVVLPVASATIPIDASTGPAGPRPFDDVEITQILDERKAEQGELVLEVKAQAVGLVPSLDALVELAPEGFEVAGVDDQGVSVSRFADDQDGVVSERTMLVTMKAREGPDAAPTRFRFGAARDPGAKVLLQRYDDANLVPAEAEVELLGAYGGGGSGSWWLALPLLAIALGVFVWLRRQRGTAADATGPAVRVPDRITPFTAIGFLREVAARPGLPESDRTDLAQAIASVEHHYFAESDGPSPDLDRLVGDWARRAI